MQKQCQIFLVKDLILQNPRYEAVKKSVIQEEKRLMYVAMTRPVESLLLAVNQDNGLLRLKQMGVNAVDTIPDAKKFDVLGINKDFIIENPANIENWKFKTQENKVIKLYAKPQNYKNRDQQPSSCKASTKIKATTVLDTAKRIDIQIENNEMDKIGTCIHNIFCVLEKNQTVEQINTIIKNHGLEKTITSPFQILEAWKNFETFLSDKFGPKIATYHELPFKQHLEGQIFTGSIDFIWETKDGVILVDFKSYPGSKDDVINPEHKHFAGMYAGQFECYERAIKASGKNVISKLIYYHVLGVVIELI